MHNLKRVWYAVWPVVATVAGVLLLVFRPVWLLVCGVAIVGIGLLALMLLLAASVIRERWREYGRNLEG